jgi:hypothetical protein
VKLRREWLKDGFEEVACHRAGRRQSAITDGTSALLDTIVLKVISLIFTRLEPPTRFRVSSAAPRDSSKEVLRGLNYLAWP